MRKSARRAEHNKAAKLNLNYLVKNVRQSIEKKDVASAKSYLKKAVKALDKMAQSGVVHKNTAARKKSRLSKKVRAEK